MEWVQIKDIIPNGDVLAYSKQGNMTIGYLYKTDNGIICENEDVIMHDVTHYIKLEPPKQV